MITAVHEGPLASPRLAVAGRLDRLARVPLSIQQLLFRLGSLACSSKPA